MSLRVYSTLTRQKAPFVPGTPGTVRMYVCGVTPYDLCHVGHARSGIVFDVIRRYLAFSGLRVTFVKNFTDVEDKIIRRAGQEGVSPEAVAERYIAAYHEDMGALGILPGDVEPRATAHILPAAARPYRMISLIERLVEAGVAYAVDGDVYYAVARFPGYGRLSGKNLEELLAGARVEVDERKRDPRDFALWKAAKPGEPSWPSPWGAGRPGWHIECSAMAMEYLGETIDVHGGGEDLVFPHHECEIAQSEAVTGKPFARYWIHNGFVNLGAEKMSKSLGNTLTIRDLIRRYDPEAIRLWLLGTHYRHPIEFAEERVRESTRALERLRSLVAGPARGAGENGPAPAALESRLADARREFVAAMDDDFNTPQALAALFDLARALQVVRNEAGPAAAAPGIDTLRRLGQVLGLLGDGASGPPGPLRAEIEGLVERRDEARRRRAWDEADTLRGRLAGLGVTVEDTPSGTRWTWRPAPATR